MSALAWRHDMFVYDDDDAYSRLIAPYLEEGLDEGEALMAVFVPDKQSLLRDALGSTSDAVDFTDANDVYTRPEAVLSRYDARMRRILRDGAQSIRFIGELPLCETAQQWDTWMLYEALLNYAFTHLPLRVVCTYDERVVPASVLQKSRCTHPQIHTCDWDGGEWHDSPHFDPSEVVRSLTPGPEPLPGLREVSPGENARSLRERLANELDADAMPADRARNMLVAAGEVAANAHRHADGLRRMRVGRVVAISSASSQTGGRGSTIRSPVTAHLTRGPVEGGGLWVARQLTSRLNLHPGPDGGLRARLWV
jgi:hypothetical protein